MGKNISPIVAVVAPGIIQLMMESRGISIEDAADLLYNSRLYKDLEDEKTKVWRLSYYLLYDLLEEELVTGKISYPSEQI